MIWVLSVFSFLFSHFPLSLFLVFSFLLFFLFFLFFTLVHFLHRLALYFYELRAIPVLVFGIFV